MGTPRKKSENTDADVQNNTHQKSKRRDHRRSKKKKRKRKEGGKEKIRKERKEDAGWRTWQQFIKVSFSTGADMSWTN